MCCHLAAAGCALYSLFRINKLMICSKKNLFGWLLMAITCPNNMGIEKKKECTVFFGGKCGKCLVEGIDSTQPSGIIFWGKGGGRQNTPLPPYLLGTANRYNAGKRGNGHGSCLQFFNFFSNSLLPPLEGLFRPHPEPKKVKEKIQHLFFPSPHIFSPGNFN